MFIACKGRCLQKSRTEACDSRHCKLFEAERRPSLLLPETGRHQETESPSSVFVPPVPSGPAAVHNVSGLPLCPHLKSLCLKLPENSRLEISVFVAQSWPLDPAAKAHESMSRWFNEKLLYNRGVVNLFRHPELSCKPWAPKCDYQPQP